MGPEGVSLQFCMESLLKGDSNGAVTPWLAESYKVADDLKSITFTIRKGVKFHDGTDFNAKAAQWNLNNQIVAKKQPYWASVDLIDDNNVRVNFTQFTNTNINTFDGAWMVSPTAFNLHGIDWMRNNPVGTGPFKFGGFQKDVNYKWVKNPDYWVKGKPYVDAVEINYVADPMTQKSVLLSGQVDMLQVEPGSVSADLQAQGFDYKSTLTVVYSFIPDSGHADSPYSKPKVLQAIDYAINRESIAKAFSYGYWTAPYQIPPSTSAVYNPNFAYAHKYDLAKAKALLTEAGYPNGFKTTILNNSAVPRDFAVALQSSLAELKIQAELSYPANPGAFFEASNTMNNVLVIQPVMTLPNYNTALRLFLLGKDSLWNHNFAPSPEYLKLYQASLMAPVYDPKLVMAATDQLSKESAVIPFAQAGMGWAMKKYVKNGGFLERGSTDIFNSENIWLDK
jgi:peptide/nickel transport system substrate-binding protein